MLTHCPHCMKAINLSDAQREKIESALARLKTGTLKFGCPRCSKLIELMSDGSIADWKTQMNLKPIIEEDEKRPVAPNPPDVSWLQDEDIDDDEEVRDVPMALLAIPQGEVRDKVADCMIKSFYQPIMAENATDALAQLRRVDFDVVILHTDFEVGGLERSAFHQVMKDMVMERRRYLYYILIGSELHTMYNMEALANSANLVVNETEVKHLKTILKKGKQDYEDLFGPFISALKEFGRI